MALRQEDLRHSAAAEVLAFPTAVVRARTARHQQALFLRRRVTVATVALLLAAALGLTVGGASAGVPVSSDAPRSVRIASGDTLWGLASRYAPEADPRAFVDEVLRLNDLSGPPAVGTKVRLPRG